MVQKDKILITGKSFLKSYQLKYYYVPSETEFSIVTLLLKYTFLPLPPKQVRCFSVLFHSYWHDIVL